MMHRQHAVVRLLLVAALILTNIGTTSGVVRAQDGTTDAPTKGRIVVGSKDYTEQLVLGQIVVLLLENAGYEVVDQTGIGGSQVVRDAILNGSIDTYVELVATGLVVHNGLPASALPTEADKAHALARSLDAANGIVWLSRGEFNDTYAMMVRDDLVALGIQTIDDLAVYMNENDSPLSICVENDFFARENDGLLAMENRYGFEFRPENVQLMDLDAIYQALREGQCDVGEGYATDGRIDSWGFTNLIDSRAFFPFYNPATVIRTEVLNANPELADLLSSFGEYLDDATMSALNARVDIGADSVVASGDEETPRQVALSFLQSVGLLKSPAIVVSSKDYTEQLILGQILVQLLEDAGYEVVDKTGLGGSTVVHEMISTGGIDTYVELVGTGLAVHNGLPTAALPANADRAHALARSLGAAQGLIWLDRGEFNDTFSMMVRDDLLSQGIESIDDLAAYMNENDSPLSICVENDFFARTNDGLPAMQEVYGFEFKPENVQLMDLDAIYQALREGQCDVGEGYATDGRIASWGLTNLIDSRAFFPFYNPAPVIREEVLNANPELAELLSSFGAYLDDETMSALNARVDIGTDGAVASGDEETPAQVARSFLRANDLLSPPQIVVSSKDYTEQLILGQILVALLEDAGYEVMDKTGLGGSTVVHEMISTGGIDTYVELVGTGLAVHNGLPTAALPADADRAHALARSLGASQGLVWLDRGEFNDTYSMMVRDDLQSQGIESIDDLAAYMNANDSPLSICVENDFFARTNDGLPAMQEVYGFEFKPENVLLMDLDAIYQALREGQCDVGEGYATDGRIASWGFTNLVDSRAFFPFYNPAPVIREDVLAANPDLDELLSSFGTYLDDTTMSALNARVDIGADNVVASGDEETPAQVAVSFLVDAGLLEEPIIEEVAAEEAVAEETTTEETTAEEVATDETAAEESEPPSADDTSVEETPTEESAPEAAVSSGLLNIESLSTEASDLLNALIDSGQAQPQVAIGSTEAQDAQLLGQMLVLMMEEVGYSVTDNLALGDSAILRETMQDGTLDLYFETGRTALSVYHNLPEVTLPNEPDRIYSLAKRLDETKGVVWLEPSNAASAPTLMVRQEAWDGGTTDVADLTEYIGSFDDSGPTVCVGSTFAEDERLGLTGLQEAYGFTFEPENTIVTDVEDVYAALRDNLCDIAQGVSTDGRLQAWNLAALTDSLSFFVVDAPAPLIRQEFLDATPALQPYIEALATSLNQESLQQLNAATTIGPDGLLNSGDETPLRDAAAAYLCANAIVGTCQLGAASAPSTNEVVEDAAAEDTAVEDTAVVESDTTEEDSAEETSVAEEDTTAVDTTSDTAAVAATGAAEAEVSTDEFVIAPPVLIAGVAVTVPATYGVNARRTASTDSPVVDVLPKGATLTAVGRLTDNSWIQIIMPDESLAWIFSDAVFYTQSQLDTLPEIVPPSLGSN